MISCSVLMLMMMMVAAGLAGRILRTQYPVASLLLQRRLIRVSEPFLRNSLSLCLTLSLV